MGSSPRDKIFGRHGANAHPEDAADGRRVELPRHAEDAQERQAGGAFSRRRRAREEALAEAERQRALGSKDLETYNPNRKRGMIPLAVALLVVVIGAVFSWNTLGLSLPSFQSTGGDYSGSGEDKTTTVKINAGDAGSTIGSSLVAAGVTKSTSAFVAALEANKDAKLNPGEYRLKEHQSASSALAALQDPKNRIGGGIVIPEGLWSDEIFARLSKGTGVPISEYQKVTPNQLGLPKTMNDKLDGWLFPSTYDFGKNTSALQQLKTMVDLTRQKIGSTGVPADQFQKVLTEASIIQAESPNAQDDGKVARVIENRVEKGMPLQMDSSIHYILHKRGTVTTTDADRNIDSPYNTYKVKGLPPTPYNSPGLDAIKAAANPTPGPWLYFVAVNLATGETKFATTYEEQQKNEQEFHQWCQANPGKGC